MRKPFVPAVVPAEGERYTGPIVAGLGMTEFSGSDCYAYEVVEVKDQKHVTVRQLDHEMRPGALSYSNDWDLISDDSVKSRELVKYGDIWFWKFGNRRLKANVSFGRAEYYFDYEF